MTGFGRAEGVVNGRKLTVEVRSLNSKQLDLLVKVPGSYKENEIELRRIAGERIVRGKAEVFIGVEGLHAASRRRRGQRRGRPRRGGHRDRPGAPSDSVLPGP